MCIVVKNSEKSVKSDYFGPIICNWWRRFQKSGYSLSKNAKYTVNWYEDPEYSGFSSKINQFEHFMCRILWKFRTFGVIFPKKINLEICHLFMQNTDISNLLEKTPNNWVFPQLRQFFFNLSAILQCGFTRYKSKYLSYYAKIHCSIILQNKSNTNHQDYCRKYWKFIKLGTSHNRQFNSNWWEFLTYY